MRKPLQTALLAAFVLAGFHTAPTFAADKPAPTQDAASRSDFHLPPLPADAHATQSTTVDGRTVTVGSLPVRDDKGKVTGEVVSTAYTMAGKDRPVTFALNARPRNGYKAQGLAGTARPA